MGMQRFGSGCIDSGSGSIILGWIPIRIQVFDNQILIYSWKNVIFLSKNAISLSLGLHKGRPSNLQKRKSSTSKHEISEVFSIFVGHFLSFWIRIHRPDPKHWWYVSDTPGYRYGTRSTSVHLTWGDKWCMDLRLVREHVWYVL
jgi:hypothetical protein